MAITGQLTKRGAALSLDYITGRAFQKTATHTTYLMLLTSTMNDDAFTVTQAAAVEVTTTGYARQAVVWATPAIPSGSSAMTASNSSQVTFGPFTGTGGMAVPAVAAVLVQNISGTAGDALMYWELDAPVLAGQGEQLVAVVSGLTISVE